METWGEPNDYYPMAYQIAYLIGIYETFIGVAYKDQYIHPRIYDAEPLWVILVVIVRYTFCAVSISIF